MKEADCNIQSDWAFLIINSYFQWLIFRCGYLILHQKNMLKWPKHRFNGEKQQTCKKKVYENIVQHFLFPTDPLCNMLQTLERRRKYNWSEIVSGTHFKTMEVFSKSILLKVVSATFFLVCFFKSKRQHLWK